MMNFICPCIDLNGIYEQCSIEQYSIEYADHVGQFDRSSRAIRLVF